MSEYPEWVRLPDDKELEDRGINVYHRSVVITITPEELEELVNTGTVISKEFKSSKVEVVRVRKKNEHSTTDTEHGDRS